MEGTAKACFERQITMPTRERHSRNQVVLVTATAYTSAHVMRSKEAGIVICRSSNAYHSSRESSQSGNQSARRRNIHRRNPIANEVPYERKAYDLPGFG